MSIDSFLMICSSLGEIVVLILLLRRKVWRTLPIFCIYMTWALVSDVAGYYVETKSLYNYFNFYLQQLGVDCTLQFMVLTELAFRVWKRKQGSGKGWMLLPILIAASAAAIWPLTGKIVPINLGPSSTLVFRVQTDMSALRIAALFLLLYVGRELSFGWKDREVQVAVGLGVYSIVSLAVALLHVSRSYAPSDYHLADQVQALSYMGALAYWMFCFSKQKERMAK